MQVIQSFKSKYRKRLMRHVLARINEDLLTSEIAKEIDCFFKLLNGQPKLRTMFLLRRLKTAFLSGFNKTTSEIEDDEVDAEFNELFKELTD